MQALQTQVAIKTKEIGVAEQQSEHERAAAEIVRSLTAVELCAVGGGFGAVSFV